MFISLLRNTTVFLFIHCLIHVAYMYHTLIILLLFTQILSFMKILQSLKELFWKRATTFCLRYNASSNFFHKIRRKSLIWIWNPPIGGSSFWSRVCITQKFKSELQLSKIWTKPPRNLFAWWVREAIVHFFNRWIQFEPYFYIGVWNQKVKGSLDCSRNEIQPLPRNWRLPGGSNWQRIVDSFMLLFSSKKNYVQIQKLKCFSLKLS